MSNESFSASIHLAPPQKGREPPFDQTLAKAVIGQPWSARRGRLLIEAGDRPFHNNGINHRNRAIPLVEWYKPKSLRRA
jgi:hypothetical protein